MNDMTKEASQALSFLCTAGPWANTTLDKADLRSLLKATGGTFFAAGYLCEIVATHLGADVFKITRKAIP